MAAPERLAGDPHHAKIKARSHSSLRDRTYAEFEVTIRVGGTIATKPISDKFATKRLYEIVGGTGNGGRAVPYSRSMSTRMNDS